MMKEKALTRMLKDFPWLWSIRRGWGVKFVNVTAERATKELFNAGASPGDEVWCHLGHKKEKGRERCEKIDFSDADSNLSRSLTWIACSGIELFDEYMLEHIAHVAQRCDKQRRDKILCVTIYRRPPVIYSRSLHQFVLDVKAGFEDHIRLAEIATAANVEALKRQTRK